MGHQEYKRRRDPTENRLRSTTKYILQMSGSDGYKYLFIPTRKSRGPRDFCSPAFICRNTPARDFDVGGASTTAIALRTVKVLLNRC
jgi:hypothetical protein